MSRLRPTLVAGTTPGLGYRATYCRVLHAIAGRRTLIHGLLDDSHGGTCAIGAYFREANIPIDTKAIDEIAAYNDSFPKLSSAARWKKVIAWLRWMLKGDLR